MDAEERPQDRTQAEEYKQGESKGGRGERGNRRERQQAEKKNVLKKRGRENEVWAGLHVLNKNVFLSEIRAVMTPNDGKLWA